MSKITAWSFSRWKTYEKCPRLAKYKFVDRLKEPGSAAMDRGTEIHNHAEAALRDGAEVHETLLAFASQIDALRSGAPDVLRVECQSAYTREWKPTDWFAGDVYVRIKSDVMAYYENVKTIVNIDWKTGKTRGQVEQLELYAIDGLLSFPEAQKVDARFWYVDLAEEEQFEMERPALEKLIKKWDRRVMRMLNDETFRPNPGNACRWCHFSKKKGGPCEY